MVNPLFVLLDDSESSRNHLAWVADWMIMSTYSTWLLFLRETSSIEYYFKDVQVSIDSTFLVSQPISSSEEQVMCVYRVEISDLQVRKFATWRSETGLAEITSILDEKAKNFHGKIMRIVFYDVN